MNDSMLSDLTNSIDPDYKSIPFILKNLKITVPRISEECDSLLSARREVSQSITYQLCFYVYCLLQAFKSDFEAMKAPPDEDKPKKKVFKGPQQESPGPFILIVGGTGYLAQQVIFKLTQYGLQSKLLIFCRGDITAGIWRKRGYRANHIIGKLLSRQNGQIIKPDIYLSFTSNSSFTQVNRTLAGLVSQSSAFIYTSLGLARQKAYYMLRSPTTLRTYVEPYFSLYRIKKILSSEEEEDEDDDGGKKLNNFLDDEIDENPDDVAGTNEAKDDEFDDYLVNKTTWDKLYDKDFDPVELAADLMVHRYVELINFIRLLENFYSIRGLYPSTARLLAIQTVLGRDSSISYQQASCDDNLEPEENTTEIDKIDKKENLTIAPNLSTKKSKSFKPTTTVDLALLSLEEDFIIEFQGCLSKRIRAIDLPASGGMSKVDRKWLKNRLQHDLSYTRDEEMSTNGGYPVLEEDQLIMLYSRDRKDINDTLRLSICNSDDEYDSANFEKFIDMEDDDSVNISVENILPVSDTKEDIENQDKIAAEQEEKEISNHLPSWLKEKFDQIKLAARQEFGRDLSPPVVKDTSAIIVEAQAIKLSPR